MNYNEAKEYLLNKPDAVQDYPFGPETAVFKVSHKMFATLTEKEGIGYTNLKADPDQALALRDIFEAVAPGYHMNKRHWNTVTLDGSIPQGEIERMIDASYTLVVKGMTSEYRLALEVKHGTENLYK